MDTETRLKLIAKLAEKLKNQLLSGDFDKLFWHIDRITVLSSMSDEFLEYNKRNFEDIIND